MIQPANNMDRHIQPANDMERHIQQTNDRLKCIEQQLSSPATFTSATRELLDWCSDHRAFQPQFEASLMRCLTIISQVAAQPGYDLDLAYRLLAVCSSHTSLLSPNCSAPLAAWSEQLGKLLLIRHPSSSSSTAHQPAVDMARVPGASAMHHLHQYQQPQATYWSSASHSGGPAFPGSGQGQMGGTAYPRGQPASTWGANHNMQNGPPFNQQPYRGAAHEFSQQSGYGQVAQGQGNMTSSASLPAKSSSASLIGGLQHAAFSSSALSPDNRHLPASFDQQAYSGKVANAYTNGSSQRRFTPYPSGEGYMQAKRAQYALRPQPQQYQGQPPYGVQSPYLAYSQPQFAGRPGGVPGGPYNQQQVASYPPFQQSTGYGGNPSLSYYGQGQRNAPFPSQTLGPQSPLPGNPTPPVTPSSGVAHFMSPASDAKQTSISDDFKSPPTTATPMEAGPISDERRLTFGVRDGIILPAFRLEHNLAVSNHVFHLRDHVFATLMQRTDLELQLKCFHHEDATMSTNWPASVAISVNGAQLTIERGDTRLLHRPLHIKHLCQAGRNTLQISVTACCCSHLFILQLVHRPTIRSVLQGLLRKRLLPAEQCVAKIKRAFAAGASQSAGGEGQPMSVKVSLLCPVTFRRMSLPARGHDCWHIQCFDLETYLQLNCDRGLWRCPICSKPAVLEGLEIDQYIWGILQSVGSTVVEEVLIDQAASWKPSHVTTPSAQPSTHSLSDHYHQYHHYHQQQQHQQQQQQHQQQQHCPRVLPQVSQPQPVADTNQQPVFPRSATPDFLKCLSQISESFDSPPSLGTNCASTASPGSNGSAGSSGCQPPGGGGDEQPAQSSLLPKNQNIVSSSSAVNTTTPSSSMVQSSGNQQYVTMNRAMQPGDASITDGGCSSGNDASTNTSNAVNCSLPSLAGSDACLVNSVSTGSLTFDPLSVIGGDGEPNDLADLERNINDFDVDELLRAGLGDNDDDLGLF